MGPYSAAELVQLIDGPHCPDPSLERLFATLAAGFLPETAPALSTVIRWDVATPHGTEIWQVAVSNGAISVTEGPVPAAESPGGRPRVTLGLNLVDLLEFLAGRLDGMQAFMSGRLRVSGDLMLARAMQAWFALPPCT